MLSAGTRVDRFEILELLGSGGMGEVYRARDPKLERFVALKIVRQDAALSGDGGARLLREARVVAALSHPNVVAVHDVAQLHEPEHLRGLTYIAMELVVGRSLRTFVGDEQIAMARRISWLKDVARGLAAAHEIGIVHRDMKPENVMIRFDGLVKVLDFGIARRIIQPVSVWSSTEGHVVPTVPPSARPTFGTLAGPGRVIGTPAYMAPEQLQGADVDARVDQFAWAVVAYELLTGSLPWSRTADAFAVGLEILSCQPKSAAEVNAEIPAAMSATIARALAKNQQGRFPTMAALLVSIDAPMGGSGEEAAPRESTRLGPPWRHTGISARRALASAVLLGGLVGVGVAGRALLQRVPPAERAPGPPSTEASGMVTDACTSSAACSKAHGGAAWRCNERRHACVDMASHDCKVYAEEGDLQRDDTIWFGGMFPLSTGPDFISEMRAADLARQDFARALEPSTAPAGRLHARPIGLVVCDEGKDPAAPAGHLVEDVEVPAVIGFSSRSVMKRTVSPIFLPARVLSMISITQQEGLTSLPEPAGEPRLIWRSTLDDTDQSAAYNAIIQDILEPRAKTGLGAIRARSLRFAVLEDRAWLHDTPVEYLKRLRFNSKGALENGDNFREFVFDPNDDASIAAAVASIVRFQPHVVFQLADVAPILDRIEATWVGEMRPSYLTGSDFQSAILAFIGKNAERRHRFFSVTNVSTTLPNAELVLRYNQAFPKEPILRTNAPQPSYDGFYLLAYAALSLGDAPITGPALSRAIPRLISQGGRPVDVGPTGVTGAFEALRAGGSLDLNGALGSLDFDITTGEAPVDYAILCCGVDDTGAASGAIESGLVYHTREHRLTGTLRCP